MTKQETSTISEVSAMKTCKVCGEEKTIDNYYVSVKDKYRRTHGRCKPCHGKFTKQYYKPVNKAKGFALLSIEMQEDICKMLEAKTKKTEIAKKHGLIYPAFTKWCRQGKCVLWKPTDE